MLSKPKNPKDYKDREVNEFEQAPLYLEQPANLRQQPKLKVKTVEIKKESGKQIVLIKQMILLKK